MKHSRLIELLNNSISVLESIADESLPTTLYAEEIGITKDEYEELRNGLKRFKVTFYNGETGEVVPNARLEKALSLEAIKNKYIEENSYPTHEWYDTKANYIKDDYLNLYIFEEVQNKSDIDDLVIVEVYDEPRTYRRSDAIKEFKLAYEVCGESGKERYGKVLESLMNGEKYCKDE